MRIRFERTEKFNPERSTAITRKRGNAEEQCCSLSTKSHRYTHTHIYEFRILHRVYKERTILCESTMNKYEERARAQNILETLFCFR